MAQDLIDYSPPPVPEEFDLEFLSGRTLEDLEEGIRNLATATDLLALAQGCAVLKIEREGLYREAGYESERAYQADLPTRLKMARSTISERRKMADAWLTYRKNLARTHLEGHVNKLIFLDRAVGRVGQADAMAAFRSMSYRDFREYARGPRREAVLSDVSFSMDGDDLLLDGDPLLSLADGLDEGEAAFIVSTLKAAYRARKGNLIAHVVAVYDPGEARAVDNFLKKFRAGK